MRASREYTTSRPSAPGGLTGSSLHPSTRLQVGVGGPGSSFSSGGVSGGGSGGGGGAYFPHHGSAGSAYNTPSFSPAASPVASTLSSRPLSATSFKARSSSSSTPVGSAGGSFHFAPTSLSSASGGGASSSLGSVSYSTRGRAPSPSPTSSVARLRDRLASAQIEDMEEYFTGHPSTSSSTHTTASPRSVSTTAFIATPSLFSQPSSHSLSSSSATGTGLSSASNPGSTASRSRLGLGVNTGVSSSSGGGAAAREHRESSSSSHAGSHQIVNAIREQLHAAALNAAGAGVVQASNSQTTLQLPRAVSTSQGTSASSPSASPIPSPSPSDLGSDDDLADMPSPILHNASLAKQARPASAVSAHLGERMGRESPLVKPVAVSSPALASFAPPSASPSVASTTSITTPLSLSSATSFSGDLAPLSAPYVPTSLSHGPAAVATVAAINPNEITIHVCDENRGVTQDFRCDRSLLIAGMKYFRTYLQPQQATQTLYQEEIDISVHCDLFIFQWLLNYITWERQNGLLPGLAPLKEPKNSPARPEKPLLDVNNVVSILISSDFLQMASLVSECIAYMCGSGGVPGSNNNSGELVNILRTPVDLKCLSEQLVLRIAREGFLDEEDAFFPVILDSMRNDAGGKLSEEEKSTHTQQQHHRRGSSSAADGSKVSLPRGLRELLRLNDKRDKIASRLWMVKLENLLDHRSGFLPLDAQGNIFADEESDSLPPGALTTRRKSTLCMCQNCEQKFWKDEFEEELGGGDPYMVQLRALHPHLAPPLPQTALHPSANFCPSLVAHRRVNFHGEITATHRVSEGWNIKKWLLSLRVTHQLNWEQIWWICYGLCHRAPLDCPCAHCGAQSFLYSDIKNCRYHEKEAVWVKRNGSTGGVVHGGSNGHTTGSQLLHPCCGRPSMPFTPWSNGCRSRVHSIQPRTQREKTIYEVAKKFAEAISWSEKEVPATGVETEVTPELAKKKSITFGKDSFSTIGGTTSTTTSASTKDKTSVAAPSILGPALSSTLSSFSSTTDALSKPRSKHPAGSEDESDGGGRKQRRSSASGKVGKSFAALEGNSAEESEEEERRQSQRRRHRRRRSNVASDESGSDDDMDSYDDQDDDDGEGNSSEEGEEEGEEDDEGDDDDGEEDDDEDEDSDGGARRRRAAALTPAQKAQAQAERLKFHKGYQRTNPHGHVPRPSTAAAATGPSHAQRSRSSSSSTRGQNPVVSTNKAKANMSLAEKALQQLRDVLPASEYNALAQTVANSGGAPSIGASQVPASSPTSAAASSSIPAKRAQSAGIRVTTTGKRPATSGGGGGVGQSRKSGPTVAIKSILKPSSGASVTIPSAQPTTSSPTMDEFSSVWGAPPVRAASPETSPVSGSGGSGGGSNVGAFNPYASPTASPDRKKKSGAYDLDSLLEDDRQRMTNLISNLTHSRAATTTATHNPPQATTTAPTTAAQGRGGRLDRASSAQVRKPVAAFK